MINIPLVEEEYLRKYYLGFEEYLKNKTKDEKKFQHIKNWYRENSEGKWSFESVVKAKPEQLSEIKEVFEKKYINEVEEAEIKARQSQNGGKKKRGKLDIEYLKDLYSNFAKIDNQHFQEHVNGLALIKKLDLKVCPYCNRNFINSTKIEKGKVRRTADFDHFYDKSAHPYLAISFYNLIPSCKVCNHIKSTQTLGINPYLIKNNDIQFDYKFQEKDINSLVIDIHINNKKFKENWDGLGLEGHYESHSNYLVELIERMRIYKDEYLHDILKILTEKGYAEKDHLIGNESLKRILIGNILDETEFSQSTLSKLTRDIFDKYG